LLDSLLQETEFVANSLASRFPQVFKPKHFILAWKIEENFRKIYCFDIRNPLKPLEVVFD